MQNDDQITTPAAIERYGVRHLPVLWKPPSPVERWAPNVRVQRRRNRRARRAGLAAVCVYLAGGAAIMAAGQLGSVRGSAAASIGTLRVEPAATPASTAVPPSSTAVMVQTSAASWPVSRAEADIDKGAAVLVQGGRQTLLAVPSSLESLKQGAVIAYGRDSYVVGRVYSLSSSAWRQALTGVAGVVLIESSGETRRVAEAWPTR